MIRLFRKFTVRPIVLRRFTGEPYLVVPRVNVDFPSWIIRSLDKEAGCLGVMRQSIIKVWISERLKVKIA